MKVCLVFTDDALWMTDSTYGMISVSALLSIVAQPCNETNAIRLTYTIHTFGRLEVCSGGYWETVCSLGTTSATSTVACRQLNHAAVGKNFFYTLLIFRYTNVALWDLSLESITLIH